MDCEYQKHIECEDNKQCQKCGWNPEVSEKRKRQAKNKNQVNLVNRMRAYREKAADDALRVMASQIGGTVTTDTLKSICIGEIPQLGPGEALRIDKVLRRIEGIGNE